eukprot:CAMPEP_0181208574 /NCGR_PEP_ID=MMETSP1096-20121128/22194_1 /TAXON_ID=156174 ORGANISM="Chrysochromulina ericina, Strain CCMP281" /NCGR_SAMPLE_ID=MMETSP1096 /ASSEMBLY_ACC=CAM_ASM_000453 /LENGTH=351 /DNA_ID=CAMNT_0023299655 /DNA_START=377 /DNA_END=1428 /DNA_ORIENTATION=-
MATPTAGVSRQGHGIVAIVSAAPGANASQAAMYRSRAARRSSLRCRDSRCATCASAASAARCLASRARISSASNHADFSCQRRRLAFAFAAASSRALVSAANASALLRDISAATPPNQSPSSSLASAHPASSPQPYGSSPASNSASSAKRSRHAASEERPSESTTPGALEAWLSPPTHMGGRGAAATTAARTTRMATCVAGCIVVAAAALTAAAALADPLSVVSLTSRSGGESNDGIRHRAAGVVAAVQPRLLLRSPGSKQKCTHSLGAGSDMQRGPAAYVGGVDAAPCRTHQHSDHPELSGTRPGLACREVQERATRWGDPTLQEAVLRNPASMFLKQTSELGGAALAHG